MVNDPIADLLTRIRNANERTRPEVKIPTSKLLEQIVGILKEEGYIEDFEVIEDETSVQKLLNVKLKYSEEGPAISHLERISKPGLRRYLGYKEMTPVLNNIGIGIVSTSKGIMTTKSAIDAKVGGEYLCEIW